jgi:hypothetical protein
MKPVISVYLWAQDRDQWQTFVNILINLESEDFLDQMNNYLLLKRCFRQWNYKIVNNY